MSKPFLSLNIPKPGLAGWPIAASSDPALLREFKHVLIREWQRKTVEAGPDVEAELCRLELDKLTATLDLLIPEEDREEGIGSG